MIRINLLSDRQAKDRRIIQQQFQMGMFITLVATLLCVFYYAGRSNELSNIETEITEKKSEKAALIEITKKVEEMQNRQDTVAAIMDAIRDLKKIKAGPTPYLDSINILLPQQVWLSNLRDNMGSIKIEGFSFSPQAVSDFMTKLSKSGDFSGVDLKSTEAVSLKGDLGGKSFTRDVQKFTVSFVTRISIELEEQKAKREAEAKAKEAVKKKKKADLEQLKK
ncbi:MAG: PilN domain-containing protein [Nitrospinota bacterium]|nr:PilN domain-containing protein [Nitrospinota bacterium]